MVEERKKGKSRFEERMNIPRTNAARGKVRALMEREMRRWNSVTALACPIRASSNSSGEPPLSALRRSWSRARVSSPSAVPSMSLTLGVFFSKRGIHQAHEDAVKERPIVMINPQADRPRAELQIPAFAEVAQIVEDQRAHIAIGQAHGRHPLVVHVVRCQA